MRADYERFIRGRLRNEHERPGRPAVAPAWNLESTRTAPLANGRYRPTQTGRVDRKLEMK
jgi:hypothetical protein